MSTPDGQDSRVVARSIRRPWPPGPGETVPTAELVSDLERLEAAILAAGWEPAGSGASWSARRFVWPGEDEPPALLEAGVGRGATRTRRDAARPLTAVSRPG